jgi:hypothetical protein
MFVTMIKPDDSRGEGYPPLRGAWKIWNHFVHSFVTIFMNIWYHDSYFLKQGPLHQKFLKENPHIILYWIGYDHVVIEGPLPGLRTDLLWCMLSSVPCAENYTDTFSTGAYRFLTLESTLLTPLSWNILQSHRISHWIHAALSCVSTYPEKSQVKPDICP